MLCPYIDGLVERHDQSIDHGIAQLGAAVSTAEPRLFVGIGDGRYGPLQPAHGRQRADPSPPAGNRTPPDRGVAWPGRYAEVTRNGQAAAGCLARDTYHVLPEMTVPLRPAAMQ